MKTLTIEITLYKFNELSDTAKQFAIDRWRDTMDFSFSLDEIFQSLTEFASEFNVNIRNYELGYNSNIDARLSHIDDGILEVKGARLLAYLHNNYSDILFERKGYGEYEKKQNGNYDYKRRSRINIVETTCPLTGVCFDEDILQPIRDFIRKPNKHTTLETLLKDCISSCEESADSAYEYENSDANITETILSNDYDFTVNGEMY